MRLSSRPDNSLEVKRPFVFKLPSLRSLRAQLMGAILLVLAAGLVVLLLIAGAQMSTMAYQAFTNQQETLALAVANSLSEPASFSPQNIANQLQLVAHAVPADTNLSVVDSNDTLMATTNSLLSLPVNAPETLTALLHGTVASATRDDRLYVAAAIIHDGRQILGAIWLDTSLTLVNDDLRNRWLALIGATIGALVLGAFAAWRLEARIVRPLAELRRAAGRMAEGHLDARASGAVSEAGTADELLALGKAFNTMAEQVEAMVARQREFVANASHELRAPLAAIKLRAESLANGALDPTSAQEYAAEIDTDVGQLAQLVADLLQLTRAEDGTFSPPLEPIAPADVLTDAVRAIRPRVTLKRQQLTVDVSADLPDLFIYPSDLRIMVSNLLDNAIKYTPDCGIIRLTACSEKLNEGSVLMIEVRDSGPGIPPEDLPRVTERFFRVDRAHTRQTPGMGLGLAITLALARRYGGTLTLNSTGVAGEGTTAQLRLPVARPIVSIIQR